MKGGEDNILLTSQCYYAITIAHRALLLILYLLNRHFVGHVNSLRIAHAPRTCRCAPTLGRLEMAGQKIDLGRTQLLEDGGVVEISG